MWLKVGSLEVKLGQVNIPRDTPCVQGELLAAVLELPARAGRLNLGNIQSAGEKINKQTNKLLFVCLFLELPGRAGCLNLGKVQSKGNLHIHPSYLFCYQLSSYVIKRFINGKAGIKQASRQKLCNLYRSGEQMGRHF